MFTTESLLDRPADLVIARLLETQLDFARRSLGELKRGENPEALHDFRVALRRFRSIASLFPEYGRALVGRKSLKALKRLARGTNDARDAEVRLHWIKENESIIPDDDDFHTGYATLHDAFDAEYRQRSVDLRKLLRRRFKRLQERMLARLRKERHLQAPSFGSLCASTCARMTIEFREGLMHLRGERNGAEVHRVRVLAKRFRYLLEPLSTEVQAAAQAVSLLKDLQTELGDLHDHLLRCAEMLDSSRKTGSVIYHGLMTAILERGVPLECLDTRIIRPSLKGVLQLADHLREQLAQGFDQLGQKLEDRYTAGLFEALEAVPREIQLKCAHVEPDKPALRNALGSDLTPV